MVGVVHSNAVKRRGKKKRKGKEGGRRDLLSACSLRLGILSVSFSSSVCFSPTKEAKRRKEVKKVAYTLLGADKRLFVLLV